jgi:hypothetical protein
MWGSFHWLSIAARVGPLSEIAVFRQERSLLNKGDDTAI